ncbi:MAG TPA: GvpL/GvpF family gas vesicle protein [Symbiobacteriaceae bacterium]
MEEAQAFYLYGLMAAGAAPTNLGAGIGGTDVNVVHCEGFDALVSQMPLDAVDFEPEAVLAHEAVLTGAMPGGTVLPAAFGHLFPTLEELCGKLELASGDIMANLSRLAGRVEVGLKATWRKANFLADIDTPQLQELTNKARKSPGDTSLAIAVGQMVEQLIQDRRADYVADICHKLAERAVDMRLNDPLTTRMIFSAAFLISADQQDAFFRQVEIVAKPYEERLEFHYSGPWPPHNFARIRIS